MARSSHIFCCLLGDFRFLPSLMNANFCHAYTAFPIRHTEDVLSRHKLRCILALLTHQLLIPLISSWSGVLLTLFNPEVGHYWGAQILSMYPSRCISSISTLRFS